MHFKQIQLENEMEYLKQVPCKNKVLLKIVQKNINKLQKAQNETKIPIRKRASSGVFIRNAKEALYRYGTHAKKYYNSILMLFTYKALQTKTGTK